MASPLAVPQTRDNLRISQLLPTVKCSDCADMVVLSELAEHVCRPKPSSALLSKRIEEEEHSARVASPAVRPKLAEQEKNARIVTPTPPPASTPQRRLEAEVKSGRPKSPATHHKRPSSNLRAYGRASPAPKIPLPATPASNPRSTPSPTSSRRTPSHDASSIHTLSTQYSPTSPTFSSSGPTPSVPPVITPPVLPPNTQENIPAPSTSRPQLSIHVPPNHIPQTPNHALQPPTPGYSSELPSPRLYDFPEPETQVGGEAGMAGVGRRGFAAAARAAMFAASALGPHAHAQHQSLIHTTSPFQISPPNNFQHTRPTPHLLDITVATLNKPSDAPLSDGDTNSPSPSTSPLPKSPSPQVPVAPVHARSASSHSSESGGITAPIQDHDIDLGAKPKRPVPPVLNLSNLDGSEAPGISSPAVSVAKLPFFEKFKTKLSTPTVTQFPSLPNPFDSTEETQKSSPLTSVTARSRQSSASSSYSSAFGHEGQRQRKLSSASSSSYNSVSFSFTPKGEDLDGDADIREPASPTISESDCGLAYADDTDAEDEPVIKPSVTSVPGSRVRFPSTSSQSSSQGRNRADSNASSTSGLGQSVAPLRINKQSSDSNGVSFDRERTISSPTDRVVQPYKSTMGSVMMRTRSNSASSTSSKTSASSSYSRTTGVGLGMLVEKAQKEMETVWEDRPLLQIRENSEEPIHSSRPLAQRANTVPALTSPDGKPVKLPSRSKTERESVRAKVSDGGEQKMRKRRVKICVRCESRIEDGRWVNVDNEGNRQGGVLCERCWKNMYLPKCRRCNLPIETQAVSSSDGQLKGKYHKQCFNCHQCHKPFPDKSFYVFEGKPFCAYHYHEANDSLCAAALCGQPIEGPCAVSHAGDRYHPEHLTCEWPDELGGCAVRLVEYWEVGGRMLCEKHSQGPTAQDANNSGSRSADKSQKRITRFIDLAGAVSGKQGMGGEKI